jgi:hypothetical protein
MMFDSLLEYYKFIRIAVPNHKMINYVNVTLKHKNIALSDLFGKKS